MADGKVISLGFVNASKNDVIFKTHIGSDREVRINTNTSKKEESLKIKSETVDKNTLSKKELDKEESKVSNEVGITYRVASKRLDNGARLVVGDSGLYVDCGNDKYILLDKLENLSKGISKIWLVRTGYPDWKQVVGFVGIVGQSAGYISIIGNEVIYKKNLSDKDEIRIKIN